MYTDLNLKVLRSNIKTALLYSRVVERRPVTVIGGRMKPQREAPEMEFLEVPRNNYPKIIRGSKEGYRTGKTGKRIKWMDVNTRVDMWEDVLIGCHYKTSGVEMLLVSDLYLFENPTANPCDWFYDHNFCRWGRGCPFRHSLDMIGAPETTEITKYVARDLTSSQLYSWLPKDRWTKTPIGSKERPPIWDPDYVPNERAGPRVAEGETKVLVEIKTKRPTLGVPEGPPSWDPTDMESNNDSFDIPEEGEDERVTPRVPSSTDAPPPSSSGDGSVRSPRRTMFVKGMDVTNVFGDQCVHRHDGSFVDITDLTDHEVDDMGEFISSQGLTCKFTPFTTKQIEPPKIMYAGHKEYKVLYDQLMPLFIRQGVYNGDVYVYFDQPSGIPFRFIDGRPSHFISIKTMALVCDEIRRLDQEHMILASNGEL